MTSTTERYWKLQRLSTKYWKIQKRCNEFWFNFTESNVFERMSTIGDKGN